MVCCFRYHKGTDFQANHNQSVTLTLHCIVVLDTTKVQIFKQITTHRSSKRGVKTLFQIPQRYRFSSKSQQLQGIIIWQRRCFRYHKGTDFQANHNYFCNAIANGGVVLDTTKVQIFKQITTQYAQNDLALSLFQIPQRYRFSSKSQLIMSMTCWRFRCFRYHKGTDFQANHN